MYAQYKCNFKKICRIHSWLNMWAQSPKRWRADYVIRMNSFLRFFKFFCEGGNPGEFDCLQRLYSLLNVLNILKNVSTEALLGQPGPVG